MMANEVAKFKDTPVEVVYWFYTPRSVATHWREQRSQKCRIIGVSHGSKELWVETLKNKKQVFLQLKNVVSITPLEGEEANAKEKK